MMINKKLSVLAAAIVSVSAQAAFDSGSQVFIAIDSASGDTYVQDLGITGSSASEAVTTGFGSYTWTILGASNGGNQVAGPPSGGTYRAYEDNGILSVGATSATKDATVGNGSSVGANLDALNLWLGDVQTAAGSSDSVTIAAGAAGSYDANMGVYYNSGRMLTGTVSGDLGLIRQSNNGGNGIDGVGNVGGTGRDGTVASVVDEALLQYSFDGSNVSVSAVPVPAAAWLFGSALAGLTVVRRRK
jgi:hypothetical protein